MQIKVTQDDYKYGEEEGQERHGDVEYCDTISRMVWVSQATQCTTLTVGSVLYVAADQINTPSGSR